MRLTSPEVKNLLLRGQRQSVGVQRITFTARTLPQRLSQNEVVYHPAIAKLAVAVPKRLLKRAVDRNRTKRVLREAFRLHDVRTQPINAVITLTSSPKSGELSRRHLMTTMRVAGIALLNKVVATNALQKDSQCP
jgi:ribonuclease P protein component